MMHRGDFEAPSSYPQSLREHVTERVLELAKMVEAED